MKEILLSILRNKDTKRSEFREAADKLSNILAIETIQYLETVQYQIVTPFNHATGKKLKKDPILIVILRAGFALLPAFLKYFSESPVGFIGLKRDELTAKANLYYLNLPEFSSEDQIILLDPTIATGGTGTDALNILKNKNIPETNIIFVSILCAQEGIQYITTNFQHVKTISVSIDPELNKKKFIVPGFGDFGDRYFGTE